jgi:hypothetical protein
MPPEWLPVLDLRRDIPLMRPDDPPPPCMRAAANEAEVPASPPKWDCGGA